MPPVVPLTLTGAMVPRYRPSNKRFPLKSSVMFDELARDGLLFAVFGEPVPAHLGFPYEKELQTFVIDDLKLPLERRGFAQAGRGGFEDPFEMRRVVAIVVDMERALREDYLERVPAHEITARSRALNKQAYAAKKLRRAQRKEGGGKRRKLVGECCRCPPPRAFTPRRSPDHHPMPGCSPRRSPAVSRTGGDAAAGVRGTSEDDDTDSEDEGAFYGEALGDGAAVEEDDGGAAAGGF
jgi:hypothetical protein